MRRLELALLVLMPTVFVLQGRADAVVAALNGQLVLVKGESGPDYQIWTHDLLDGTSVPRGVGQGIAIVLEGC